MIDGKWTIVKKLMKWVVHEQRTHPSLYSSPFSAYLRILHYGTRMEVIILAAPVCTYSHSWLQVLYSSRGYLQDLKEWNELYSGDRKTRNECRLSFVPFFYRFNWLIFSCIINKLKCLALPEEFLKHLDKKKISSFLAYAPVDIFKISANLFHFVNI